MWSNIIRAIAWFLTLIGIQAAEPVICSVNYRGLPLCFHPTVREAVKQYGLSFKPPGHYYKDLPDSTTVVIYYNTKPGDFLDDNQSSTVLYDRAVDAYVFIMTAKDGLFSEELRKLEILIGGKMSQSKQEIGLIKDLSFSDKKTASLPNRGIFTLAEGWTNDSIHVFLRDVPRLSVRQIPQLQVIFTKGREQRKLRSLTHAI